MGVIRSFSDFAIPVIFIVILLAAVIKKIKAYDLFVEGAKEGIETIIRIIPSLVGLLVAVGVFKASGAMDILIYILRPLTDLLGMPPQVAPLALLRPISGSASFAFVTEIIKNFGPDTFEGRVAAVMMGSTETIFYTLAVYYGAVGIKNIRYTLAAAIMADIISVIASLWACRLVFG
ncbi:spore maturation protein B [Ruminiclostridium sufflavum DSM 19573]|uniref:Spore maturation protein B n=1 Tax=Ruminiclostridium sufflavum DSM 19573 TaxID=1121337 RepID=A0A318XPX0_9FIRM|nr:nucleoside recognition domain-containing protein [Ruminiclostridium sufflavum]PYG89198.1 spore maturation protein B [Ruminiclostridium sufflavum DSM 19573]